jgi:hypothetical protein
MTEKKKVNKTENIKEYRKQWERENRSCKARGVKHSGIGLPACYGDLPKIPKTLVIKRAPKDNLFKVTFD